MTRVGFSGTREGMTRVQCDRVRAELAVASVLHHGMCRGADTEAHEIAVDLGIVIVGHPALASGWQVWRLSSFAEMRAPMLELARNLAIVEETELLLAAPRTSVEERRSGTWSTVRRARAVGRRVVIVGPDGELVVDSGGPPRYERESPESESYWRGADPGLFGSGWGRGW